MHTAVATSLPVAALLGWDIPELVTLITPTGSQTPTDVLAVVTHQQTEKNENTPVQ